MTLLMPNNQGGIFQKNPQTTLNLTGAVAAYYDANTESSLTLNNQSGFQSVSQWNDLSGNARHLSQATAGVQPRLVRGMGNLQNYSQTFANSYWTKTGSTATDNNTTAPDGTNTGSLLTNTTVTAFVQNSAPLTVPTATNYTASVYLKKSNNTWSNMQFFDGSVGYRYWFNLDTGTIGANVVDIGVPSSRSWTNLGQTITNVGNGWFRCTISAYIGTSTSLVIAGPAHFAVNSDGIFTGGSTIGQSVFAWGAMLNEGTTANEYIGRNSVSTDGVDDRIFSGSFVINQPYSRHSVVTRRNASASAIHIINSRAGVPNVALFESGTTAISMFAGTTLISGQSFTNGQSSTFSEIYNGATSTIVNNGNATTGNANTNGIDGVNLGNNGGGGAFSANDIHALLVMNRLPTTDETFKLEAYLSRRYGNWRGLAQGNPYRYHNVNLVY